MAAAVVSTLRAFGDLIVHEANFLGGFPDGVEWLNEELQWIQSFLKDDANSRRRKADERTKTLTRQIRDVAYEIEDLTDIIRSMSHESRYQSRCFLCPIWRYALHPFECLSVHRVLVEDPMEQLEQLPNLLHLSIMALSDEIGRMLGDSCVKSFKTMTCTAGGFPNLQSFEFFGSDVKEWKVEISAMPKLTQISIYMMKKLRNIPDGLLHITSLNELMFFDMSCEFVDRIREGDDVSWNIIRYEDEGKHMTIVPIRPISSNIAIDSTDNVLPDANYGGGDDVAELHDVTNPQ
ncbi:disease resistance RPP13-like protein 3 [Canna indica]|uniref:Disease resistance RPP13-like protein 3 n=1 Tax=Canna indica TaxID=4628 RepID=A0AAQ3KVU7_9LILI|nr:disease resistance RPP13-like protein 3 [Canna indica]